MSANWSVRSFGDPYFVMEQFDPAGMFNASGFDIGITQLSVQFRLFRLPVQYALNTENHALISYLDSVPGTLLLEMGLTPLGALTVQTKHGANFKSIDGLVAADDRWHTAYCSYDTGSGTLTVAYDDVVLGTVVDAGGDLLPSIYGRVRLFNGASAVSRSDVAIRYAEWTGSLGGASEAGIGTVYHYFTEKGGGEIAGTNASGFFPGVSSFRLYAVYKRPRNLPFPWGPIPSQSGIAESYEWTVNTEYADITPAATAYEEVGFL